MDSPCFGLLNKTLNVTYGVMSNSKIVVRIHKEPYNKSG